MRASSEICPGSFGIILLTDRQQGVLDLTENISPRNTTIFCPSDLLQLSTGQVYAKELFIFFFTAWVGNSGKIIVFNNAAGVILLSPFWGFLFSRQLLIQFRDIVIPLSLVASSCHWCSQAVFLPEALDLEFAAVVSAAVGEVRLAAGQGAWLLIHQPHIPMETWVGQAHRILNVELHTKKEKISLF